MSAAGLKTCPMCGEHIPRKARACRFCGEEFEVPERGGLRTSREDLRQIAIYQKAIIGCILLYFGAIAMNFLLPVQLRGLAGLSILGLGVVATTFVFLLALKVYTPGMGVLLGFLTLIPCIGLITLLTINQKATGILTQNGYKVGLLGVSLSKFNSPRGEADVE